MPAAPATLAAPTAALPARKRRRPWLTAPVSLSLCLSLMMVLRLFALHCRRGGRRLLLFTGSTAAGSLFHRAVALLRSHLNSGDSFAFDGLATQTCRFLALLALHHHGRTLAIIMIGDLAVQTVVALVGVDMPLGMNRLDVALVGTNLAGLAALLVPTQPVEQANAGRNRQTSTQRADVAAIEFVIKSADHQQQHRIEDKAPFTLELEQYRRLEWLDLGVDLGLRQRL